MTVMPFIDLQSTSEASSASTDSSAGVISSVFGDDWQDTVALVPDWGIGVQEGTKACKARCGMS